MSSPTSSSSSSNKPYVCDTIPAPRLASSSSRSPSPPTIVSPPVTAFQAPILDNAVLRLEEKKREDEERKSSGHNKVPPMTPPSTQPTPRKLCVRHQRMADEGTNLKLQQALDALPVEEREAVNAIWTNFSSSPHPRRALILQGLLTMCCFSQLSLLTEQLAQLIRIDPFAILPREVLLKILGYLDATSLCRAAQVSKQWKSLADDDILWRGICEQHIGQKCLKCGWGLPILEKRRAATAPAMQRAPPMSPCPSPSHQAPSLPPHQNKRELELESPATANGEQPPAKRQRTEGGGSSSQSSIRSPIQSPVPFPSSSSLSLSSSQSLSSDTRTSTPNPNPLVPPTQPAPEIETVTRPWKDVYCERLTVERNWRRGRCVVRTLKGHTDGVMCLQFSETLSHPAFPILITGSYDRTARVWNLETGRELHCLTGHTRAVRALQFDECKLITGSMDHTMKVWDWRTGKCLRTLEGHTEGVVCLNFDSNVLASGSVDSTVKVWNFRTGECFTLRGHRDWVNSVQLWDAGVHYASVRGSTTGGQSPYGRASSPFASSGSPSHIAPGKMLFSASDDGTIRLWDLYERTCVRQFTGHVGQVQSLKLLVLGNGCEEPEYGPEEEAIADSKLASFSPARTSSYSASTSPSNATANAKNTSASTDSGDSDSETERASIAVSTRTNKPVLISGSLDNTIKLWDIETGKATRTLFGHIEGVWAVASDNLRLVSGSHDRTIKVWNREEGRCTCTLVGHRGAVTCLALGEDKIVSGSDDGDIRLWSFSG
ncbi:WD40 repeat-like protein [Panus rudis PR-1116 ss-1]|nr:WD40 repeat-like protein [Panus rudis PR-1116 ss-1]